MELELNRNHMSCYDTVLDTTVFHEETMEMIVPDACPDILRIVDTSAAVCLRSKEAQEGRAEVTGSARCAVLYLPDGEMGVRRLEVSIPFSCNADGPGIKPGCAVTASPRVQCAETRVINPRKVLVKVNLAICIRVYCPAEDALCSGACCGAEQGVEQLCETHSTYVVACVGEKPFNFSDDLTISGSRPEAEELLKSRVTLMCNESKIIGSKLIFKGQAALQVFYRAVGGALASAEYELPFSQIMEVSGVEEEADCTVEVLMTDWACALAGGDSRTISVSMGLLAQAVVREERSVELLSDLYSIGSDLTPELKNYTFHDLKERNTRRQTTREMIETGAMSKTAIDAYVNIGAVSQTRDGTKMTFSAEAMLTVVYIAEDDELRAVSRQVSVPCQTELPEGCVCSCMCRCPGEVFATPTTGGLEVRFDLDFEYMALSSRRVAGVCGAQMGEAALKDGTQQPSIVLRVVGAERLWDIAKSYRTTVRDVMQANELESGESVSGKLLLIPKKR